MNLPINQIICGSALEVLKTLPGNSINCCISSPPYWALRDYGVEGQLGLEKTFEEYLDKLLAIYDEVKRVLRKDGTCFVNLGDTYGGCNSRASNGGRAGFGTEREGVFSRGYDKCLLMIPERFAIGMIERGWILRNKLIWHKPNPMPSSAGDRFTVDFEPVFFFSKAKSYFFEPQYEEHKTPPDGYTPYEEAIGKSWHNHNNDLQEGAGQKSVRCQNPLGRNKRCVWTIPTQACKEAHFACVDTETEILTIEGWKKYSELKKYKQGIQHIKVATFNIQKEIIEYQRLSYVKEYKCNELLKVGNRDLDILMTKNHRNVVEGDVEDKIVLAENLTEKNRIRVSAPVAYPANNGIGIYQAELVGWIIAEGHYKKGGFIEIYQNEGANAKRIDELLDLLQIPHTRKVRRINQVIWFLKKCPFVWWMLSQVPDKTLTQYLVSLPQEEIKKLFDGLILGDGHTRKDDGRITFIQKNRTTQDWFQILALRLNYHSIRTKDRIYLTVRTHIGIRKTNGKGKNIQTVKYDGIVWCPKTPNGTWVARRNGRVFITGNTYPEKLVQPMIEAGCPMYVCDKCGKPRKKIYEHKLINTEGWGKAIKDHTGNITGSQSTIRDGKGCCGDGQHLFKGYSDCGCNAGFTSGIVLDPFGGMCTTAVVAYKLKRDYLMIELNKEYIKMAEKRLHKIKDNYSLIENNPCIVPEPVINLKETNLFKEQVL